MNQEQRNTIRAAEGLARRERWPAGLLPAVQLAVTDADPTGPDAWYGQGDRWEAIADALVDLAAERPADADRLSRLLTIAQTGAGIQDEAMTRAAEAGGSFAQGIASDVRAVAAAVPVAATSARTIAIAAAVAVGLGVGWYYWRGPGSRGR